VAVCQQSLWRLVRLLFHASFTVGTYPGGAPFAAAASYDGGGSVGMSRSCAASAALASTMVRAGWEMGRWRGDRCQVESD
jgi:hypothetical protein